MCFRHDSRQGIIFKADINVSHVTTAISNVRLEGARIVRVVEDADQQRVTFEVTYPIPEGGSDFPRRRFAFQWCSRYLVDEGRGAGEPTIQRVETSTIDSHRATIRMHTDKGFREVTCWPEVLEDTI